MKVIMKNLMVSICFLCLVSCVSTSNTPAQQRSEIQLMSQKVLKDVYKESPSAKTLVANSAGYAVFSNAQINLLFIAAGGGYGVVHNNSSGKNTYMNMGEAGVGFGLGVKDFRVLFIFKTQKALNSFVNDGWSFGAEADAAAKSGNKGAQISRGVTIGDITVYQLTENGLALQATVKGTKYWKSADLN